MFSKIYNTEIKTDYNHADDFTRYHKDIMAEFNQSIEEGLDLEKYKSLFNLSLFLPIPFILIAIISLQPLFSNKLIGKLSEKPECSFS